MNTPNAAALYSLTVGGRDPIPASCFSSNAAPDSDSTLGVVMDK